MFDGILGRGCRQTNSSYCIDDTFVVSDDTPDPANIIDRENSVKTRLDRNIANWLYEAAKSYYASYHEYPTINYEELFYLAGQAMIMRERWRTQRYIPSPGICRIIS